MINLKELQIALMTYASSQCNVREIIDLIINFTYVNKDTSFTFQFHSVSKYGLHGIKNHKQ